MPVKLAFRNIERQISSYVIYFITVVFTVALMFAVNNVLFSDELWAYNEMIERSNFGNVFVFFIAIVTLVVCFIICYATAFLLRRRKKEFGTYLLLGIKRSSVMLIFVVENLLIGAFSFICGGAFGIGVFQILNVIICAIIGNSIPSLQMSLLSLPITLLQWAGIIVVALFMSSLILRRTKINDLIKGKATDKKLPKLPLLEKIVAAVMFCLIVAACAAISVMVWLLFERGGVAMKSFCLIGMPVCGSVLVVAIFFFYVCLRSMFLQRLKYKKPKAEKARAKSEQSVSATGKPTAPPPTKGEMAPLICRIKVMRLKVAIYFIIARCRAR